MPKATLASFVLSVALGGCSSPSSREALAVIERDVVEDASCTLSREVMSAVTIEHASKGLCVAREGGAKATACTRALAAAGLLTAKRASYLVEWPDAEASASLGTLPASSRRSRSLLFSACYELADGLREGRFACADVKATSVARVDKIDDTHATVRYLRTVTAKPGLEAIEAACGPTSRPPPDATASLAKVSDSWQLQRDVAPPSL